MLPETSDEAEVSKGRILAEVKRRNRENPQFDFAVGSWPSAVLAGIRIPAKRSNK